MSARWLRALLLAATLGLPAIPLAAREMPTDQIVVHLKAAATSRYRLADEEAKNLTVGPEVAQRIALGRQQAQTLAADFSLATGVPITYRRHVGSGAIILRLAARADSRTLAALMDRLAGHPDVERLEPDRLAFPARVPADPEFVNQWALGAAEGVNAPAAWDITTGSASQVVAVIDTGLLTGHAEFAGRLLPGFDFVSNTDRPRANDGGGRDADASDPGDWVTTDEAQAGQPFAGCQPSASSWHGTKMAAIIAANATGTGIAGLNWNARILPVRAMGKCGGYVSDIADALRWASGAGGIADPTVPANPNPARVINMSLVVPTLGACDTLLRDALVAAGNAGSIVVVAAGNANGNASDYSPGNCALLAEVGNAVVVTAVGRDGGLPRQPAYSNTGPPVLLSAPGGSLSGAALATPANGILTASDAGLTAPLGGDATRSPTIGTSGAAAHVTGVASLMKAVNAALVPADLKTILANTARVFPSSAVNPCNANLCGSGILDAARAVDAALKWGTATRQVAAGSRFTLGLRSDGVLFAWGDNSAGQLAVAGVGSSAAPVQVALRGVRGLTAGTTHAMALRADGSVMAWGENSQGQLGDGTTVMRTSPKQVAALNKVISVAAGGAHSLALRQDGTAWAWGNNEAGQLGDGTTNPRITPAPVPSLSGLTAIAAGASHSLARRQDGTVWAWGNNSSGQLGDNTRTSRATPVLVTPLTSVTALAGGRAHSLALRSDGTVWAWGSNFYGQLGDGTNVDRLAPVLVPGLTNVIAIAAGSEHSIALRSDGSLRTWGLNSSRQLADGSTANRNVPVVATGLTGTVAVAVAASETHSVAVANDGAVWSWGSNLYGQLGNGNNIDQVQSVLVVGVGGTSALGLELGAARFIPQTGVPVSTLAVSNELVIPGIAAGSPITVTGGEYQVDGGPFTSAPGTIDPGRRVRVRMTSPSACVTSATATLNVAGILRAFNVTTQACDLTPDPITFLSVTNAAPSTAVISNAVAITGINAPTSISIVGGQYSIGCNGSFTSAPGLVSSGQSICLRVTAPATFETPTTAMLTVGGTNAGFLVLTRGSGTLLVAPMVTAGNGLSFGLRSDGVAFGWGNNSSGQLGIGTLVSSALPKATLLVGLKGISTNGSRVLALRAGGTVWQWGAGQTQPVQVAGLADVKQVAAGSGHFLAVKSDGTVVAWGSNFRGQLGNGTTIDSATPVPVSGLTNVKAVAAGGEHSLAVKNDGTLWAWGRSNFGQTGGGPSNVLLPVQRGSGYLAVAAGEAHSLGLRSDGIVMAWGWNADGQVGNNGVRDVPDLAIHVAPTQVLTGASAIAAGERHSIAIKADGTVWTWGLNSSGQLGDGTKLGRLTPVAAIGLSNAASAAASSNHSLVLKKDGSVWSFGSNTSGALGDGLAADRSLPFPVADSGGAGILGLDLGAVGFAIQVNAPTSSLRTSNSIVISGIAPGSQISISGGEYRIDNGPFTSSVGTINPGQQLMLRQVSSSTCFTNTTALVSIAGVLRGFDVITIPCDASPDPFFFDTQFSAPPATTIVSNTVTITGLTGAVPISVEGGQYSMGCGSTFTGTAGNISSGQTVCVRLTTATTAETLTTATLTVGGRRVRFQAITAGNGSFATAPKVSGALALRADGLVVELPAVGPARKSVLGGVVRLASGYGQVQNGQRGFGNGLVQRADGTVWSWGQNAAGQLGDGTTVSRDTPAEVVGLTNVTDLATGGLHALAMRSDGTVWAWGDNTYGQLGDGTIVGRALPAPVPGLASVKAIAAGDFFSAALTTDGTVWVWGRDIIRIIPRHFLNPLSVDSGVAAIAARGSQLVVLRTDGTVAVRAFNGIDSAGPIPNFGGAVAIADMMAVKADGSLWSISFDQAVQVAGVANPIAIGGGHFVKPDGSVWFLDGAGHLPVAAPDDSNGDLLYLIGSLDRPAPFHIASVFGVAPSTPVVSNSVVITGLGSGVSTSVAVTGGEVSVNGGAFTGTPQGVVNGQEIRVRMTSASTPETLTSSTVNVGGQVSTFYVQTRRNALEASRILRVALGYSHSYLLEKSGKVFVFGANGTAQLGNGNLISTSTPLALPGVNRIARIAAGYYHGLALTSDGIVKAWGSNVAGQVGDGTDEAFKRNPVTVTGLGAVKAIAAGRFHSLALQEDGTVWSWGLNAEGQLGTGNPAYVTKRPALLAGLASIVAISAGGRHSLALAANGTLYAWGSNASGQLGDGTVASRPTPVPVPVPNVIALAACGEHSLVLKSDGTVWSFGGNGFGQLGVGGTDNRSTATQIPGLAQIGAIACGDTHSLAIRAGGGLFSWGGNGSSQLGEGTIENRATPQALAAPTDMVAIAAGGGHSAGLDKNGRLFLWGDNVFGQVGNKSGNYLPHLASLNVLRGDSNISEGAAGSGGGVGASSSAGSGSLSASRLADGYDFEPLSAGAIATTSGSFSNVAASGTIQGLSLGVSGPGFQLVSPACPTTLAAGQSCEFVVQFAPQGGAGEYEGLLAVSTSNLDPLSQSRTLVGRVLAPAAPGIAMSREPIAFPPQVIGQVTPSRRISITNPGTATLVVSDTPSSTADFAASHTCSSVPPGGECGVYVFFYPRAAGSREATITLVSNAGNQPLTLSGEAVASASATPDVRLLTITRAGTGTGTVVSAPAGVNCGADCSAAFVAGTVVSLTATPSAGSEFRGWSGACGGAGACNVTMDIAKGVTATFRPPGDSIPRLGNISTRMQVLTGNDVLIGGFIIGGSQAKTVVVRARGPSLIPFGIPNALANPTLQLFSGQTVIASNNDWGTATNAAALTTSGFAPSNALESAILTTLTPGAYTAIVSGVGGTTGVGIIEVFEVDHPETPLANISTRGSVLTGGDVMIGGFIIMGDAPQTVIVRARGPSLVPFGITNALMDPVLQLFNGQVLLEANDDWQTSPAAATIQSAGFAPSDAKESVIRITLPPGAYTAIVTGKNGTTGVGIIEVFAQ